MKTALALSLLALPSLFAQAQFEVASVRPNPPIDPQQVDIGLHLDGTQARISGLSLRGYIAMAYRVKEYQVQGPDWLAGERFQINATLPAGSTTAQIPEMLQSLLTDRFGLKFHREQKEVPAYILSRGKRALTLVEVVQAASEPGAVTAGGTGSGNGVSVNLGGDGSYTFANNKFEGKKLSMASMVDSLAIYMDLPVVDRTELKGFYDVSLDLVQEDYRAMLIRAARANGITLPPAIQRLADTATTPSLFDAIENVGLKLEAGKVLQDVLVVDEISKTPTEN